MKSTAKILAFTISMLTAAVALADSPAIQQVLLDDRTAVSVPVATNRVTTISFPSAITAIDGAGVTADGKTKLKSPSGTLSTAEAIGVMNQGLSLAGHFGDGTLRAADLAGGLLGAVIKDPVQDRVVWQEYLETVVKERDGWKDFYRACKKAE